MRKIELSYTLSASRPGPSQASALLRNPMMDVLHALRSSGSISGAARELGLSYRHVWGQLKDWEADLGQALIIWERGQAARLTPFGERLLMAERLAQARLGPQMEGLRAELERAFSMAFEDDQRSGASDVLTLYASHDHALTELQQFAGTATEGRNASPPLHLDIRFCGSVDAIRALNEGRCGLAGFHTQPFASADSLSARTYRPQLKPGLHKINGYARRSQGLMVAP
ncbi:MAG: LysR family transcriptional regulator, partial [Hydrogenophaga sp.]|uniref:LysR family transcriptional regulator n=1 Tax=Hydrogenophaga sp. TaxID=1904254 RepID=UPI003D0BF658